jgi:hypothetical protein
VSVVLSRHASDGGDAHGGTRCEFRLGLEESTPLRYYVLREGGLAEGGQRLGPVGAGAPAGTRARRSW